MSVFSGDVNADSTGTHATVHQGRLAEQAALTYLLTRGCQRVASNWRARAAEIDLIVLHERAIVFVEIRSVSSTDFGGALATVGLRKQAQVVKGARAFLGENPQWLLTHDVRFDVLALWKKSAETFEFDWCQNAFLARS